MFSLYVDPVHVGIEGAHSPLFSHCRKLSIRCIQLVEKITGSEKSIAFILLSAGTFPTNLV